MDGEREELIEKAQMSEQAERYPDMVEAMKTLAEKYPELTNTERNLLSVAYKNVVGARRSAWRVICSIEGKSSAEASVCKSAAEYRVTIAEELNNICGEVLVRMSYYEQPSHRLRSTLFGDESVLSALCLPCVCRSCSTNI